MTNSIGVEGYEDVTPTPEYLIKSIAEQGYSLESALADLIDNCISAEAEQVEIIINTDEEPYTLYLADDGKGMDSAVFQSAMRFPSSDPDQSRGRSDLGRFGLGLKTASFSQTRKFSVISRSRGEKTYRGRTWDVDLLKSGNWLLKIDSTDEILEEIGRYSSLSNSYLNSFLEFSPNTIVVWQGLYKFEKYLGSEHRKTALKREITEVTTEYLSLVFHRFMQKRERPLKIRVNNVVLEPFDPFPTHESDVRPIEHRERSFGKDSISVEGFVLPARSIKESSQGEGAWTTKKRSLMDMEGIYLYRIDRIISFGGWNQMIRKAPRLQLARLRVEIGNQVDHLLHLNVAKSQIEIPHDLRAGFEEYVEQLKLEAEREYFNRNVVTSRPKNTERADLFQRNYSNKGMNLAINQDFPIYSSLYESLSKQQKTSFKFILRMLVNKLNSIRKVAQGEDMVLVEEATTEPNAQDLELSVKMLIDAGISAREIRERIIPDLGYSKENIPLGVWEMLGGKQ